MAKNPLDRKIDRLESVPEAFFNKVDKDQAKILAKMVSLLSSLGIEDGNIKNLTSNYTKVEAALVELTDFIFNSKQVDYKGDLKGFFKEINNQITLNNVLLDEANVGFKPKQVYNSWLKNKNKTIRIIFGKDSLDQELINVIRETLNASIATGGAFKDMVESLRVIITGDAERLGKWSKHVKTFARDSFAGMDRSYTTMVANDLGLEWYRYEGGTIQDTRCFCLERAGGVYHRTEIEAWGAGLDIGACNTGGGNWQGKNPATTSSNIFTLLGGFNCIHVLIPVSEDIVSESDKARAGID